jgi:hypothetical protein
MLSAFCCEVRAEQEKHKEALEARDKKRTAENPFKSDCACLVCTQIISFLSFGLYSSLKMVNANVGQGWRGIKRWKDFEGA